MNDRRIRKLLFINAVDVAKEIETTLPHLGLGYLVSSLRRHFGPDRYEFKIIDRDVEQHIRTFQPDLVGITAVSQNYNRARACSAAAKQAGLPVVVGGVHISALPGTLAPDMDVGVIGEGERTIIDLVTLFEHKGCFEAQSLAQLPGVVFRHKGEIVTTPARGPIEPLDTITPPARDLLPIGESTYMFTSRGCPYRCTFCASCRFWGKVRLFSAEYVVAEIKDLMDRYGVRRIFFWDDLFVADPGRLRRIVELLTREGIPQKMEFSCHVRSNLVTNELVELLRAMNVRAVGMGLESGSPATLAYLKGRNIQTSDHVKAIRTLRAHGIRLHASFIIGAPQETREDILQTLAFIRANRLRHFSIYVLTPYPGTPVWDYARARNLVSEDMDWDRLNVVFGTNHEEAVILSEKLTRAEIYELFRRFVRLQVLCQFQKAWRSPRTLGKLLRKVLSGKPLVDS